MEVSPHNLYLIFTCLKVENVFFKNKSEAGESGDYQNNIGVQPGEHRPGEQTLSNDPEDAKGRVKKEKI